MTNSWNDIANAKAILIEGSNAAENHPMSAKYIMRAKEKGAKVIHVDPRFTRTSKISDIHAQLRPGTDVAFMGSIINYIIQTNAIDEFFVDNYTNSKFIVRSDFKFDDGIFSGYDKNTFMYDISTWNYELDAKGLPKVAASKNDPNCVYQKMKQHYSRYTFELASDISGVPVEKIKEIADVYINNRPGTMLYALGLTQHTVGVQNIRCMGIIQLLLGNVGKAGTGINALRGEPNVQGTTDFALLFHYLPGYLSTPNHNQVKLADFLKSTGTFRSKFFIALMKAWYGDNATAANDYGYDYLPKKNGTKNYSIFRIFETAVEGQMKCMYVMGQNPAVTSANLNLVFAGLDNLETLIVADPFMTETASFWERPGADPKNINTEVIFLPANSFLEKDGTLINSARMVLWRYGGTPGAGTSKPDLELIDLIFTRIKELYADSTDPKDEGIKKIAWNYQQAKNEKCATNALFAEHVLREINGYNLKTGQLLNGIGEIKGDGTTSGGNWLYAGCFAGDVNKTKRKDTKTDPSGLGLFPEFSWTWPGNMRILYNRASCDAAGKPFDEANKLVWWDEAQKKWTGYDIPDVGSVTDAPNTPGGKRPFRMSAEGVGRFFAASYAEPDVNQPGQMRDYSYTNVDAPFPEFYEPVESPTTNVLHPKTPVNPALRYPRLPDFQKIGNKKDFPYVLCTSSVTEHWCCGAYTRNVPWLNELVKETYMEMPVKLAEKLNVKGGDMIRVSSARGEVKVKVMVTERIQTLMINGEETTVVWMPYNWGFKGLSQAASTNLITIDAGDPNTWIQETKACLVNIEKIDNV
jgi:formate dehydrogenase major subunit